MDEFNESVSNAVPSRLLRRLSAINSDGAHASPANSPPTHLSMRRIDTSASPSKRQIKNYDMKQLESQNGGLGWVGPIYGNKTHSSKRFVSPNAEDRSSSVKRKGAVPSNGRRESMLGELYPNGIPDKSSSGHHRSTAKQQRNTTRSSKPSVSEERAFRESNNGTARRRDTQGSRGSGTGDNLLISEQKKLLRLLQDSIRAEEESASNTGKRGGSVKLSRSNGRQKAREEPKHRHRSNGQSNHSFHNAPKSRHQENQYMPIGTQRDHRPLIHIEEVDSSSDSSSSDASAMSGSDSSSSSDGNGTDANQQRYGDDVSSLGSDGERFDSYKEEQYRGRDRNPRKSARVRYVEETNGRPRGSRRGTGAGPAGGLISAHSRYGSPSNTSSTVAAARAGISHNFFELYGSRPGGVRVPDNVKISSMVEKATPIRPSSGSRASRRLASPTVSSGRRFHTPELDRVHSRTRRSESADSYNGLTDAAEWSRLTEWLGRLKLQKYAGLFRRSGITKLSLVELLRAHDLSEIGIDLNDHPRLLNSIQEFSRRTISFAEEALSPHEERLPNSTDGADQHASNEKVRGRTSNESSRQYNASATSRSQGKGGDATYVTSRDVLSGDRRSGAVYRPLSTADLLRLGSPEGRPEVENPPASSHSQQASRIAPKEVSPPVSKDRMTRSGGSVQEGSPVYNPRIGGGSRPAAATAPAGRMSEIFNSTPTGVSKATHTKMHPVNPVVESTLLSMNKAFWLGDEPLFFKIWNAVIGALHQRADVSAAVLQASYFLELFSRVYFVTWPQRAQIRGKEGGMEAARARFRAYIDSVLSNQEKYASLIKSREFANFIGVGFVPDAVGNAAYACLFLADWTDGLARRLNAFLASAMHSAASGEFPNRETAAAETRNPASPEIILGGGNKTEANTVPHSASEIFLGSPNPPAEVASNDSKMFEKNTIVSVSEEPIRPGTEESVVPSSVGVDPEESTIDKKCANNNPVAENNVEPVPDNTKVSHDEISDDRAAVPEEMVSDKVVGVPEVKTVVSDEVDDVAHTMDTAMQEKEIFACLNNTTVERHEAPTAITTATDKSTAIIKAETVNADIAAPANELSNGVAEMSISAEVAPSSFAGNNLTDLSVVKRDMDGAEGEEEDEEIGDEKVENEEDVNDLGNDINTKKNKKKNNKKKKK